MCLCLHHHYQNVVEVITTNKKRRPHSLCTQLFKTEIENLDLTSDDTANDSTEKVVRTTCYLHPLTTKLTPK